MGFIPINVSEIIEKEKQSNEQLSKAWDESRIEYKLISDLIRMRKEQGLSQSDLANLTGYKQQVISRLEKKESNPTLKTLCDIVSALNYDIQLVKRS